MSFKVHGRSWVDGQCVCQSPFQVLDGYNHDDGSNVGIDIDIDREAGLLKFVLKVVPFHSSKGLQG